MEFNWFYFFNNLMNHPQNGMCLRYYDFSSYKVIKTPKTWKNADLSFARGLHGSVDFSSFDILNLTGSDFEFVISFKFNPYAQEINLSKAKGLQGILCCNCMGKVILRYTDMSKVFRFHAAKKTDLTGAINLFGFLDCKDAEYLNMTDTDVSRANVRFNPMAKKINLTRVKGLSGVLDFGNAEHVILFGADLSRVPKIICGPSTILLGITNFSGVIEYSSGKQIGQKIKKSYSVRHNNALKQTQKRMNMVSKIKSNHR